MCLRQGKPGGEYSEINDRQKHRGGRKSAHLEDILGCFEDCGIYMSQAGKCFSILSRGVLFDLCFTVAILFCSQNKSWEVRMQGQKQENQVGS